jgi:hypothetical protein
VADLEIAAVDDSVVVGSGLVFLSDTYSVFWKEEKSCRQEVK